MQTHKEAANVECGLFWNCPQTNMIQKYQILLKIALQTLSQLPNLSTTAQPSVQRVTNSVLNSGSNSCVGKTICRLLYTLKKKKIQYGSMENINRPFHCTNRVF